MRREVLQRAVERSPVARCLAVDAIDERVVLHEIGVAEDLAALVRHEVAVRREGREARIDVRIGPGVALDLDLPGRGELTVLAREHLAGARARDLEIARRGDLQRLPAAVVTGRGERHRRPRRAVLLVERAVDRVAGRCGEARLGGRGQQRAGDRGEPAVGMHHDAELALVDRDAVDLLAEPDDAGAVAEQLGPGGDQRHRLGLLDPQRRERRDVIARGRLGRHAGDDGARNDRADQARRTGGVARHDRHAEAGGGLFRDRDRTSPGVGGVSRISGVAWIARISGRGRGCGAGGSEQQRWDRETGQPERHTVTSLRRRTRLRQRQLWPRQRKRKIRHQLLTIGKTWFSVRDSARCGSGFAVRGSGALPFRVS